LRYHPDLPYYYPEHEHRRPTKHPALIAAIQGPDGRVVSLHRIYLTADGHKATVPTPKKFMSPITTVMGAAIRLDPATDELVVTEGVETALAVRLMTGMPTWAALSAAGMANLRVPETVRLVVIAADHDAHGKGQEAARQLCDRLLQEGRQVKILIPETPETDWADALVAKERASHV
jgi:putative DNA primase/helicase